MKRHTIILICMLFSVIVQAQQTASSDYFYYYKGKKVHLAVDSSHITIVTEGELPVSTLRNANTFLIEKSVRSNTDINVAGSNISQSARRNSILSDVKLLNALSQSEYNSLIADFKGTGTVLQATPSFIVENERLSVSNNFYVKLRKAEDLGVLYNLANEKLIEIIGYNEYMPLWYTLSCGRGSLFNSLEAANFFHQTQLFEYAEPELLYHNLASSNDQYFPDQWGLKNTGQHGGTNGMDIHAEDAWTITTGSPNVKVAIFDHGIELNHPDLSNNIHGQGYDATTSSSPSVVRGNHGVACAGIVGAVQNNTIGVSGVAPNSKLMSISINLLFSDTPQQLANGFNWAWQNGADVISNSWGGYAPSSIIDEAISNTLANGRNGKGTVVVFASGNENNTAIRYPGNNNPAILVVGASSPCGERKSWNSCDGEGWGACYGNELDIVAPGVFIPTTDRQGSAGYAGGDYVTNFNGTSSACPHAAGVAALILSVNPDLTQKDVVDIIESTARKIGQYTYSATAGRPNGSWNNEMGYGLLDAYAAVVKAQSMGCPTIDFSNRIVNASTTVTGCKIASQSVTVTNGAKLTLSGREEVTINPPFTVNAGSQLEIKND